MANTLKSRLWTFALAIAIFLPITGCIEIERVITLKPDMSGQAQFRMSINMEAFARMGIEAKRKAEGKTGALTDAEIAEAMKQMSGGMEKNPPDKAAMAKSLPAGITLVDVTQKVEGFKISVGITLGFDDVKKLMTLKLDDKEREMGPTGGESLSPFYGLQITESGQTLTMVLKPIFGGGAEGLMGKPADKSEMAPPNPIANATEELPKLMQEMLAEAPQLKELIENLPKQFRETFRLEAAWPVLETNATKKDAKGVAWEYTLESLMKMTEAERNALTMSVVVRKK
jgi:hypothetical protein